MSRGSLDGLRVIDLTTQLSGPYCTMVLSDLGADVIKVESPDGDSVRQQGPYHSQDVTRAFGGYFQSINRNKRSLVVDLKTEAGRDILLRLVETADVLVENFRVGVMERLGLPYERLSAVNPKLVYAALRGFGDPRTGESPYSTWPSYDVVAQAMGGLMGITGPDADHPTKVGPGAGDIFPGIFTAVAVLAALRHAERTGEGQFVDVSMYDSVVALCERIIYQHSYTGVVPKPQGNGNPQLCPFDLFPAADGHVTIATPRDHQWDLLCRLIGRPELSADERYVTNTARVRHAEDVRNLLSEWTGSRTVTQILDTLGGHVAVGAVHDAADLFEDQHIAARNMIVEVEHPGCPEPLAVVGRPMKFTRTPGPQTRRAPLLGEHGDEVLTSLGYSATQISELHRAGVLGTQSNGSGEPDRVTVG
ncbi:MAG: formyl-CoA transferase [Amycolatopsis sp.]|jgi:crotonobetainyl-CoA:carnitine CoA-transferase CaiB-like acyl-CoA transferase|uniref:CaiB/BaiF CoA transferase family protein n=1 Tax=Amycolatopsis sp. TaxID=37632 RepID=UPI0026071DF7|nr:CoA transferase [Amycolatopsis sp.]MCU1683934.1 formyl-CoA transferase [Amycolatopsis sp.]